MAISWMLQPDDVARIRFAFSPAWELVASLRTLQDAARQAIHLPWTRAVRPRLSKLDIAELFGLVPRDGYLPDFLTPPPQTPAPDFPSELERIRQTPVAVAYAEVSYLHRQDSIAVQRFLADPAEGLARVADTLAAYWDLCFAEYWPRIRALLEADVTRRSRQLVSGGARELFTLLNPAISWTGDRLIIKRPDCVINGPQGNGLVLVPSAFHWPAVAVLSTPDQSMLVYPVQGVGMLWEQGPPPAPDGLAALIGRSRARMLVALAEPTTTTALAHRLALTTGAVSQHLGVLRSGGLAVGERVGKKVYYRRTPTGDALVGGR